jgi:hypothetical protein
MAMNCRTCQYELSQCLDGRVPSGRRALVMQHTDDCGECARFWSDLQKAQELVLRLPSQHISGDFREQLFERIRSGEGTPEAVFREPVPLAVKLRYAVSGALAAAALLVVTSVWRNHDAPRSDDVAKVEAPTKPSPGGLQPRVRDIDSVVVPLTPNQVAAEATQQMRDSWRSAHHYASLVNSNAAAQVGQTIEGRELRVHAAELQRIGGVLIDLKDAGHLTFVSPFDHQLPEFLGQLEEATRSFEAGRNGIDRVARVVLQAGELTSLPQRWQPMARPGQSPEANAEFLQRLFRGREEAFMTLFVALPTDGDLDPILRDSVFQLHNECGQTFVVSRRAMQRLESRQFLFVTSEDDDEGVPHRVQIQVTTQPHPAARPK